MDEVPNQEGPQAEHIRKRGPSEDMPTKGLLLAPTGWTETMFPFPRWKQSKYFFQALKANVLHSYINQDPEALTSYHTWTQEHVSQTQSKVLYHCTIG